MRSAIVRNEVHQRDYVWVLIQLGLDAVSIQQTAVGGIGCVKILGPSLIIAKFSFHLTRFSKLYGFHDFSRRSTSIPLYKTLSKFSIKTFAASNNSGYYQTFLYLFFRT